MLATTRSASPSLSTSPTASALDALVSTGSTWIGVLAPKPFRVVWSKKKFPSREGAPAQLAAGREADARVVHADPHERAGRERGGRRRAGRDGHARRAGVDLDREAVGARRKRHGAVLEPDARQREGRKRRRAEARGDPVRVHEQAAREAADVDDDQVAGAEAEVQVGHGDRDGAVRVARDHELPAERLAEDRSVVAPEMRKPAGMSFGVCTTVVVSTSTWSCAPNVTPGTSTATSAANEP